MPGERPWWWDFLLIAFSTGMALGAEWARRQMPPPRTRRRPAGTAPDDPDDEEDDQ